jgi:allene oxide cyclase-like protein
MEAEQRRVLMGKRLALLGTAIALVALAVGVMSPAWGSSGDRDRRATFRVDAVTTEQQFLDLGAAGSSLGDQIVFTTRLLKGQTEAGHQGGVCTVTSVERQEAQCIATYSLRGGQITGQALIVLGNPAPYAVAITGGSGKYKGVEGEVRVQPVSGTRGILTFHLQD